MRRFGNEVRRRFGIDAWTKDSGVATGHIFRLVNRRGCMTGERMGEKVVWQMLRRYAAGAGVPGIAPDDLRRTCAKLCRASGGELEQNPVAPRARVYSDH